MSTAVMDLVQDGYPELVDPEHFDNVMQGVADTIAGTESLTGSYTWAQTYLYGCLDASDSITNKQRAAGIAGMEGMVGDAANSFWEYIKKIFKGIWDFFFGDGSSSSSSGGGSGLDSKVKKVETNVKKAKEGISKVSNNALPEEEAKVVVKKVKAKAQKVQKDPKASSASKAKAKAVVEKIEKAEAEKKPTKPLVKEVVTAALQVDDYMNNELKRRAGNIVSIAKKWVERNKNDATLGQIHDPQLKKEFTQEREEQLQLAGMFIQLYSKDMGISDISKANSEIKDLEEGINHFKTYSTACKKSKTIVDKKISEGESAATSKPTGDERTKIQSYNADLRYMGNIMSYGARAVDSIIREMGMIIGDIKEGFGIE